VFEVWGLFPRFTTVTEAVPAPVRSEVLMVACRRALETTEVARCEPFHSKTAVGAKFAPCTVRVNPRLPGGTVVGERGSSMKGIGTFWPNALTLRSKRRANPKRRIVFSFAGGRANTLYIGEGRPSRVHGNLKGLVSIVSELQAERTSLAAQLKHIDTALSVLGKLNCGRFIHEAQAYSFRSRSQEDQPGAESTMGKESVYERPSSWSKTEADNVDGSPLEDCGVPASEMGEDKSSTEEGCVGSLGARKMATHHLVRQGWIP
jgi:hypothetical protein